MPLQKYSDYGGQLNPAANALLGFRTGTEIMDQKRRRKAQEANALLEHYRWEQEEIGKTQRHTETLGQREKAEKERTERTQIRYNHLDRKAEEDSAFKDRRAKAAERSATASERRAKASETIAEVEAKLKNKKYDDDEADRLKKEFFEIMPYFDTSSDEAFIATFRPMADKFATRLKAAGFEDESVVMMANSLAIGDRIKTDPEARRAMMTAVDAYKRMAAGTKEMSKKEAKETEKADKAEQAEFNRLKSYVPLVLRKYVADVPDPQPGEEPMKYLMRLMTPTKNALEIAQQKADAGDAAAKKDLEDMKGAYERMATLSGLRGGQSAPAPGAPTPGPQQGIALPREIISGLKQGQPRPVRFPDGSTHYLMLDEQGQPVEVQR